MNTHFYCCFNHSLRTLDGNGLPVLNHFPEDLLYTEEEVIHLLSTVDPSKARGPDLISAKMLKATATSVAPAVSRLFNLSLTSETLSNEWKTAR